MATGPGYLLTKVAVVTQGLGFPSPPCHILLVDVLGLLAADVVEEAGKAYPLLILI